MKWTEHYNCHTLVLTDGLSIHVNWSTDRSRKGYDVVFVGRRLKQSFDNLPTAKKTGVEFAKHVLKEGLAALEATPE